MRPPPSMPPQLIRLVLLAAGIVVAYSVARYCLTPPSFRQYGWSRGAALTELRTKDPVFAGKQACEECHGDELKKLAGHAHKSLSCEGCHGPSQAHTQDPDNAKVKPEKPSSGDCLRCHEANPSRPKWHKQIVSKTHNPGSKCTECHVPHMPDESP